MKRITIFLCLFCVCLSACKEKKTKTPVSVTNPVTVPNDSAVPAPTMVAVNAERGYRYSYVYDKAGNRAQFSFVYFSNCEQQTLDEKTQGYALKTNYPEFRVSASFPDEATAEADRKFSKKQFVDQGIQVAADNNFFGNCEN